jgi:hypothetical protein
LRCTRKGARGGDGKPEEDRGRRGRGKDRHTDEEDRTDRHTQTRRKGQTDTQTRRKGQTHRRGGKDRHTDEEERTEQHNTQTRRKEQNNTTHRRGGKDTTTQHTDEEERTDRRGGRGGKDRQTRRKRRRDKETERGDRSEEGGALHRKLAFRLMVQLEAHDTYGQNKSSCGPKQRLMFSRHHVGRRLHPRNTTVYYTHPSPQKYSQLAETYNAWVELPLFSLRGVGPEKQKVGASFRGE